MSAGRLVFVGEDGQLHGGDDRASAVARWTWSRAPGPGAGWGVPGGADRFSWPAFSAGAARVAAFRAEGEGDAGAHLVVLDCASADEQEAALPEGQVPLHLAWSPDAARIALLVQDEDALLLLSTAGAPDGAYRPLESGAPLFYQWFDSGRLLVHVGGDAGRVGLRADAPHLDDAPFAARPGAFCTPYPLDGGALFALRDAEGTLLVASNADGDGPVPVARAPGLLAFLPAPDGPRVAWASSPAGQRAPYEALWVSDLARGTAVRVAGGPLLAFTWAGPDAFVLVRPDGERRVRFEWCSAAGGEPVPLGRCVPTRELLFRLTFFEQFDRSHPIVSADGGRLLYAAHPDPSGPRAPGPSRLFLHDLTRLGAAPVELAAGSHGAFSPP